MTWYDDDFKQRKPIAVDASGVIGGGSIQQKDVEIEIPNDWDLFWDNIRSDMFDVVIANANGDFVQFKRTSADYSTRSLTVQVNNASIKTLSINVLFVYYQNPNQTTDLSSSFDPVSLLYGYIDLARPSALIVSQPLQRPPSSEPQTAFVKSSTDEIDIYFSTAGLFNIRANPYNDRLLLEGIYYVNAKSLDSSGTNDTTRYDETKIRFIDGFVRIRAKGGTADVDYALVCRIVSTNFQQIDIRCLIQVRDQLPS